MEEENFDIGKSLKKSFLKWNTIRTDFSSSSVHSVPLCFKLFVLLEYELWAKPTLRDSDSAALLTLRVESS